MDTQMNDTTPEAPQQQPQQTPEQMAQVQRQAHEFIEYQKQQMAELQARLNRELEEKARLIRERSETSAPTHAALRPPSWFKAAGATKTGTDGQGRAIFTPMTKQQCLNETRPRFTTFHSACLEHVVDRKEAEEYKRPKRDGTTDYSDAFKDKIEECMKKALQIRAYGVECDPDNVTPGHHFDGFRCNGCSQNLGNDEAMDEVLYDRKWCMICLRVFYCDARCCHADWEANHRLICVASKIYASGIKYKFVDGWNHINPYPEAPAPQAGSARKRRKF